MCCRIFDSFPAKKIKIAPIHDRYAAREDLQLSNSPISDFVVQRRACGQLEICSSQPHVTRLNRTQLERCIADRVIQCAKVARNITTRDSDGRTGTTLCAQSHGPCCALLPHKLAVRIPHSCFHRTCGVDCEWPPALGYVARSSQSRIITAVKLAVYVSCAYCIPRTLRRC